MDFDEDEDDIYGTVEAPKSHINGGNEAAKSNNEAEVSEEGEEYEDSDSDIDIITERKQEAKDDSQTQPAQSDSSRQRSERQTTAERTVQREQSAATRTAAGPALTRGGKPGSEFPEVHTSDVKFDDDPTYDPAGKPLTDLDFDKDLAEHSKPWRLPGSDQSDFFNYGFDEFSWATYCLKQKTRRDEAQKERSQMEMAFGGPGSMAQYGMQADQGAGNMQMPVNFQQMQEMMQQMATSGQMPQGDMSMFMQQMQGPGFGGMQDGSMAGMAGQMNDGGAFRGRGRGRRW